MSAAPKLNMTRQDVLDHLGKLHAGRGPNQLPESIGILDLAINFLGFNPTHGERPYALGGASVEGCINRHMSLTALRKLLKEMIEDGAVSEVAGDDRAVSTPSHIASRKSFLLGERYREALRRRAALERDGQRTKIRREAAEAVLKRHQEELQNTYEFMCRTAGFDPAYEASTPA
jgi:hypothetical protein